MLWPRFIAFIVFMVNCTLIETIRADIDDRIEARKSTDMPACGLTFSDFTGSETEMIAEVCSTGHLFKQEALEQWFKDGNEHCPVSGERIINFADRKMSKSIAE